ncbi:DHH phosphoesterase [Linderina pennispora]|uniref:DHH phosphoesterase n=1 Tax=Linderina pennispora TaxID=61395 RepID=A0A1Y1WGQ3_9FUNG|nr:DHH phosphoesterase [Linderina pennispora]ORX72667.1 DHH phosphoesterase [Linderina pennispora]
MTVATFGNFLKSLGNNTALLHNPTIHQGKLALVLGNESADLDSMVSSVGLAYALSAQYPDTQHIPVINVNRSDLALRPECDLLLRETLMTEGGSIDDLTFIDDFNLQMVTDQGDIGIWLADHNAPASRQSFLERYVVGIVDHHADEGKSQGAKVRQIETVGSCSTLVAERIKGLGDLVEPTLARMLLAPILIDTTNLSPAAKRATPKDIDMAGWLTPQVDCTPMAEGNVTADNETLAVADPAQLFKTLDKLKGKVSHLSSRDLLRKDYKQWQVADPSGTAWSVGISSISYRLKKWLKRDGKKDIKNAIQSWVAEQKLDIALVMTHGKVKDESGEKAYGRELLVVFPESTDKAVVDKQEKVLRALRDTEELELAEFYDPAKPEYLFFASRKQVFPAVKAIIEGIDCSEQQPVARPSL